MSDSQNDILGQDNNKISTIQNQVEKNDEHVTRLKNMIDQLQKFEQEKNSEMTIDMNKLRETVQIQNQKIRDLQETLFKSKENEKQLQLRIKDILNSSPFKFRREIQTTKASQQKGIHTQGDESNFSQHLNPNSMVEFGKYEDLEASMGNNQLNLNNIKNLYPQNNVLSTEPNDENSSQNPQGEDSSTNSESKRRSPNLRIDSSMSRSYISKGESPRFQRTMLSIVEEDLSNIVKSAQYQKELDPQLLKTLAKSIVAIKYTSKVMESQSSIICISENADELNDLPGFQNNYLSPLKIKEDNQTNETELLRLKLNKVEQDELNMIEIRKRKSSSISEKTTRIAFQPKVHHHTPHVMSKQNSQLTPTEGKGSNKLINQQNDQVNNIHKRVSSFSNVFQETLANLNLDQQKRESMNSLGSQNVIPTTGGGNLIINQIQDQADGNQLIKIEYQKELEIESESGSEHNSPKNSNEADMYQPFTHFFVLGCDKDDIKEFDKKGDERVILPGKLLYSFSDRVATKHDPFDLVKKQVSEYAFPYGLEIRKLDVQDSESSQIQQLIIPPTKHGMYDRFYFFKMRSQENFKQVQVEKQQNELLKIVNPNKVLFFTCLLLRDYNEIVQDDQNDDQNKKKSYWRNQKVFCFVSYYPFFDLLTSLLTSIQDQIKVERQFKFLSEQDKSVLSEIDSDYVQEFISTKLTQQLQQWQRTELREFGKDYKFLLESYPYMYSLPSIQSFRQKSLSWSMIGPISTLTFSNFLFILFAILSEQHVIFVSNSLCLLTKAIACFESLIMPFQWPYPIVYTLPENLMGLLGSPQPIILGINRSGRYVLSQDLVDNNPDHIFVLLDEGTILTNNEAYVKQYNLNPPSISLRSKLPQVYQKVGLNIKDPVQIYNSMQYQQIYSTDQYKKSYPAPKFHLKEDDITVMESIMQICYDAFQQKIVSHLPSQVPYDKDGQYVDYEKIKRIVLDQTQQEDKAFINNFCSLGSQIFLYFCEDFYNITDENDNLQD